MMIVANGVVGLIALALILLLFYGPWQHLCVAVARQVVFEQRDALFDMARDGKLDFASETYRGLRELFNAQIRFAEAARWERLLLFKIFVLPKIRAEDRLKIESMVGEIEDADTRASVQVLLSRAAAAMIVMMVGRSMLLVASLVVFVALRTLGRSIKGLAVWQRAINAWVIDWAGVLIRLEANVSPDKRAVAA